jgi:hypothetical protein
MYADFFYIFFIRVSPRASASKNTFRTRMHAGERGFFLLFFIRVFRVYPRPNASFAQSRLPN